MNRKVKRILEKKLGTDFPVDKLCTLYEVMCKDYEQYDYNLDFNEFIVLLLKNAVLTTYDNTIAEYETKEGSVNVE